ncbi:MAG: hypothetical protein GXY53_06720 [Desulfobulbus sp.]|nr:hypothetical protein [Desulfobulbus sp.]
MTRFFRQFIFVLFAVVLRWPIWMLIWLAGRSGLLKTLFLIYPTDKSECLDFCPDIKMLRDFLSGRPTPAGLIMNGWLPMGVYLVIPDQALELMLKKNRYVVERIVRRMQWIQKLAGAQTIGLAGQLGPIFEKRHGIPMVHPFYSSMDGNLFSIKTAIDHILSTAKKRPWQVSVAIVGGGELGEELQGYLTSGGYETTMVDVRYARNGDVRLSDEQAADDQLCDKSIVINLLPRGKDFMGCRLHERIPGSATVVDFSRPPIRPQDIRQKVVMGNRVQRQGIRFLMKLPGGWKGHELPACSMPSLVAALSGVMIASREQFLEIAEGLTFCTGLEERRTQLGWLRSNRWLGALDVQKTTVYDGRISCDVLPFL